MIFKDNCYVLSGYKLGVRVNPGLEQGSILLWIVLSGD